MFSDSIVLGVDVSSVRSAGRRKNFFHDDIKIISRETILPLQ